MAVRWLAGALALGWMLGCSTTYKLADSKGQVLTVEDPCFSPESRVDFLIGEAVRPVKASEIVTLSVRGDAPLARDGNVYYPATLMLKDSVQVPDAGSADSGKAVFMNADGYLVADYQGGELRIPLAELRALYRYEPPKEKADSAAADTTAKK